MMSIDRLINRVLATNGMAILVDHNLPTYIHTSKARATANILFSKHLHLIRWATFNLEWELYKVRGIGSSEASGAAAARFQSVLYKGSRPGWPKRCKCTCTYNIRLPQKRVSRPSPWSRCRLGKKFTSCFPIVGSILFLRADTSRLLTVFAQWVGRRWGALDWTSG